MKLSALRKLMITLLIGCLAASALAFLLGQDQDLQTVCFILIFIAIGLLVALSIARLFWKCPHCKSLLPWRDGGYEVAYCPFCGEYLGND